MMETLLFGFLVTTVNCMEVERKGMDVVFRS
uniref:Uncharacterized protein n=1 Tax=Rhizophora mucronata TaxID=61149 RepID=A0A2P2NG34_RHIMU